MSDATVSAIAGLIGALIGAGAGLLGTLVSLKHSRKLQAEQWERETAEARMNALKEAYVEYFAAFHRMHGQVVEAQAVSDGKDKHHPVAIEAAMSMAKAWRDQVPMMGSRVRLLETSAEARSRSADMLGMFSEALAKVTFEDQDFLSRMTRLTNVITEVAKFERWVIEVRFASEPKKR